MHMQMNTKTKTKTKTKTRVEKTAIGMTLAALTLLATPAIATAGTLSVKGSDTMVVLGQRWAEEYMKKNPGTAIQVTGGGSGTGISALINGTTEICEASRSMKDAEKAQLKEKTGALPEEITVAKDGLSVFLNASNPLNELTMDQLKAIFTGKITNWKDVGGADAKIIPYSRENSSGTYVFFKEHVLGNADYTPRAQAMPGTAAVVNAVSKEGFSIGYGGAAYAKGIKVIKIKKDAAALGVAPSDATVKNGTYPLSRPLFFYLRGKPAGEIKSFIDWVLSADGQAIVLKVGYFPVK
jgi:phosphate transport system substrate-binding protein